MSESLRSEARQWSLCNVAQSLKRGEGTKTAFYKCVQYHLNLFSGHELHPALSEISRGKSAGHGEKAAPSKTQATILILHDFFPDFKSKLFSSSSFLFFFF